MVKTEGKATNGRCRKKTYPERLPTNAIGGTSEKETVRPFGVTGALGCNFKAQLPIMIMDQQKSPRNLPEQTRPHHNRSGRSFLA
jgi:hypothetical protein